MKKINIVGEIVDAKGFGGYSPIDLQEELSTIQPDEPIEVEITSEGGSVFAGIQIANMLSRHAGKVTTHATGICASIATVILMSGDNITVDDNCFCLVHLPWTCCQGNANDMLREIEALKKCETAMMGYYTKHSKVSSEQLTKYLEEETWFLGSEFAEVFDCVVVPCDQQFNIAAKIDIDKMQSRFKNIPKRIMDMKKNELKEEQIPVEEEEQKVVETNAEPMKEDAPETEDDKKVEAEAEPMKEEEEEQCEVLNKEEVLEKFAEYEKTIEELRKENEELRKELGEKEVEEELIEDGCGKKCAEDEAKPEEEMVTKEECEKRVSGMQASMAKQINEFRNQLKSKEEELMSAKADITNLSQKLDNASKELSEMASALDGKTRALDMLNSNVNAKAEEIPTMEEGLAKCASAAERVAFLKSGKYVR